MIFVRNRVMEGRISMQIPVKQEMTEQSGWG